MPFRPEPAGYYEIDERVNVRRPRLLFLPERLSVVDLVWHHDYSTRKSETQLHYDQFEAVNSAYKYGCRITQGDKDDWLVEYVDRYGVLTGFKSGVWQPLWRCAQYIIANPQLLPVRTVPDWKEVKFDGFPKFSVTVEAVPDSPPDQEKRSTFTDTF